ncbi:A disintegrin and metallo ase with thrombospondin motifs 3-like [Brachionus plicatilis]|uniref:A disintegrin and metallo ase with thrombospondin motifs 3-like n=1 Tax=Brachionus plicatilis TaxID=10195 RepID=A0A3M7P809_BRAPC|nr:A disintegrin and metallo ase with thrombospondin motifs 3-like [Brachionus plicatilis]
MTKALKKAYQVILLSNQTVRKNMIKNFLILTFYIGCISSAYVSERAIDLVANSEIRNDIKVEIVDEKFNGTKFPDRLQLVLNQFELDFVKLIKRGQNAHGVYFIGEDDKLNKQEGQESEFLQEYTEMMGENKLILIKEKQENTGEFFRITGRVEVGTDQVDIDIIPIFKAQNLEALRKKIISKNLNAKKLAKSGEPVELDVEVLVVTDVSVYLAHKAFLKTTSQSLVLDYMKIYYSHVINNVNKLFKNSFSDDADLRINIKATNFLFLTRQSDSQWSNQSFVGDPRISLYKSKRVILGSRALEIFKNSMDEVQLNFDHALAFVNHDIWYDSDVSNSYTTRSSATGFSYSSGVCSQYKYSIVEDFGAFTNIPITAHHLARNLGASFDSSTDINCLSDQYYIMSPLLKSSSTKFKHRFSECSINELKRILISNGQASTAGQCLANKAVAHNLVSRKNNLTGLFYSANDQCKMLYGHNASFVQYFSDRMCRELYCRKTNMDYYAYTSGPAAEGTVCDSGKVIGILNSLFEKIELFKL